MLIVFTLAHADRLLQGHIDRLAAGLYFVGILFLGRADLHACAAAGAIFRSNLHGELHAGKFLALCVGALECRRCARPDVLHHRP